MNSEQYNRNAAPPDLRLGKRARAARALARLFACVLAATLFVSVGGTVTSAKKKAGRHRTAAARAVARAPRRRTATRRPAPLLGAIQGGPWTAPTFADSVAGDDVQGEDLIVRRAAIEALGPYNGSVVVVNPSSGRVLSIVNQKLALGPGFQPCSTIKVAVALAALNEKVVEPNTGLRIRGVRLDLTTALAHSNNYFFASLGQMLGFEKIRYYAQEFGYGEKAVWNLPGEQSGQFPLAPPSNGGVGMLSSFGEGISQTPLQFAALMSAVANGGTLYYLQYPRTAQEILTLNPKVKRQLDIASLIAAIRPGMRGAVEFGTARRARQDDPIAGKTGTCSEEHTHLGWFGSYNDAAGRKLVVVVLLTGGRPAGGGLAANIAGDIYRRLNRNNYFAATWELPPAMFDPEKLLRFPFPKTR